MNPARGISSGFRSRMSHWNSGTEGCSSAKCEANLGEISTAPTRLKRGSLVMAWERVPPPAKYSTVGIGSPLVRCSIMLMERREGVTTSCLKVASSLSSVCPTKADSRVWLFKSMMGQSSRLICRKETR